jgi:hypothetical protein
MYELDLANHLSDYFSILILGSLSLATILGLASFPPKLVVRASTAQCTKFLLPYMTRQSCLILRLVE